MNTTFARRAVRFSAMLLGGVMVAAGAAVPSSASTGPANALAQAAMAAAQAQAQAPTVEAGHGSRGSLPLGGLRFGPPEGSIFVHPWGKDSNKGTQYAPKRTVQAAVDAAPWGGTIVLRGGTYTEGNISIFKALTIQNYPGEVVWFDGSRELKSWYANGSTWRTGWTTQFDHSASFSKGNNGGGFVNKAHPMAAWPDMVFVNGKQLKQVASNPKAGQFAVDYGSKLLILGENPAGKEVRASFLQKLFTVGRQNVTLQGFGVRRYANSLPQMGVIYMARHHNLLRHVIIEDVATIGVSLYSDSKNGSGTVQNVTIRRAGLCGICSSWMDNGVIRNSVIEDANFENFNAQPSAAGIKVTRSRGLTIDNNLVVNSHGSQGIWVDESVVGFSISRNEVINGGEAGIEAELSSSGTIAGNIVKYNQYGIYLFNSEKITVANNSIWNSRVSDVHMSQDFRRQSNYRHTGRDSRFGPGDPTNTWLLRDISIMNNAFGTDHTPSMFQLYVLDKDTKRDANTMQISVEGNAFVAKGNDKQPTMVGWGASDNRTVRQFTEWKAFTQHVKKDWKAYTFWASVSPETMQYQLPKISDVAVPLDARLAGLLHQKVGTQRVGAFL